MWDMHVHIGGYDEGTKVLPRLVAYGITGVREMASPVDDILRLRRESADGTLLGPQIVAAGPILQRPLPFRTPPLVRTVTDADAKQVVDDLQAKGVDFIKVGDTLTRDAYFGIASEAKRLGLPFVGHLPVSVTALEATQAGQRSIEHFGSAAFERAHRLFFGRSGVDFGGSGRTRKRSRRRAISRRETVPVRISDETRGDLRQAKGSRVVQRVQEERHVASPNVWRTPQRLGCAPCSTQPR